MVSVTLCFAGSFFYCLADAQFYILRAKGPIFLLRIISRLKGLLGMQGVTTGEISGLLSLAGTQRIEEGTDF